MAKRGQGSSGVRRILVPDWGGIVAAAGTLEDTLLALCAPVDDPDDPLAQVDLSPSDVSTLRVVSAGARAVVAVRSLIDGAVTVEVRGSEGAARGRLRLVDVPAALTEQLVTTEEVLTAGLRPDGAAVIAVGLEAAADHLGTTPGAIVAIARRLRQSCELATDPDHGVVVAALDRRVGATLALTALEDAAFGRLHVKLTALWACPQD